MGILPRECPPYGEGCLVHCFTCKYKARSLVALFEQLAGCSHTFDEALEVARCIETRDVTEGLTGYMTREQEVRRVSSISEALWLPYQRKYHPYLERRGVTLETAKQWEVGYDRVRRRVVFPVRLQSGKLVGAVGRSLRKYAEPEYPVYLNYWEMSKGEYLFGAQLVSEGQTIVVVEGMFDAVRTQQALEAVGLEGFAVVAIMGSRATDTQVDVIVAMASEVILALDNDTAGREGSQYLTRDLKSRVALRAVYWDEQDADPDNKADSMPQRIVKARLPHEIVYLTKEAILTTIRMSRKARRFPNTKSDKSSLRYEVQQ